MDLCRAMYVRVVILLFVLLPCDSEVRVNLTATVGSSITFPDPVKERGFLIFGPKTIAFVYNGAFEIEENIYLNRLIWSSSGHFILSDLEKRDSGVYTIDSKKGTVFSKYYELKLYDPVSAPVVSCVNVSVDNRTVQCSVSQTEQITLHWFRGEQPVDSSRSGVLHITVQRQDYNSEYKCVAQNPADNKTTTVNMTTVCEINGRSLSDNTTETTTKKYVYIFIPIALTVLLVCFVIIYKKKCFKKESAAIQTQDSVQYAQIQIYKRNVNQPMNASTPSGSSARPDLTTVYDKIQMRRMTPTYSNCGEEIT